MSTDDMSLVPTETLTLESIRQTRPDGTEFWSARDYQACLGYAKWQNFHMVIGKAMVSCEMNGHKASNHFTDVSNPIKYGKGGTQLVADYHLTRYACYLIAQNGDPRNLRIAEAQSYFAIQTRRQELADQESEVGKRLDLRSRVKDSNKALSAAAKDAGVSTALQFAMFYEGGYFGLYAGKGAKEIKEYKGIPENANLLDHIGSVELAANFFRITQTEDKLRREGVKGWAEAMHTHGKVGFEIRTAIKQIGGTMPEDLLKADDIRPLMTKVERQRRRLTKPKDSN